MFEGRVISLGMRLLLPCRGGGRLCCGFGGRGSAIGGSRDLWQGRSWFFCFHYAKEFAL